MNNYENNNENSIVNITENNNPAKNNSGNSNIQYNYGIDNNYNGNSINSQGILLLSSQNNLSSYPSLYKNDSSDEKKSSFVIFHNDIPLTYSQLNENMLSNHDSDLKKMDSKTKSSNTDVNLDTLPKQKSHNKTDNSSFFEMYSEHTPVDQIIKTDGKFNYNDISNYIGVRNLSFPNSNKSINKNNKNHDDTVQNSIVNNISQTKVEIKTSNDQNDDQPQTSGSEFTCNEKSNDNVDAKAFNVDKNIYNIFENSFSQNDNNIIQSSEKSGDHQSLFNRKSDKVNQTNLFQDDITYSSSSTSSKSKINDLQIIDKQFSYSNLSNIYSNKKENQTEEQTHDLLPSEQSKIENFNMTKNDSIKNQNHDNHKNINETDISVQSPTQSPTITMYNKVVKNINFNKNKKNDDYDGKLSNNKMIKPKRKSPKLSGQYSNQYPFGKLDDNSNSNSSSSSTSKNQHNSSSKEYNSNEDGKRDDQTLSSSPPPYQHIIDKNYITNYLSKSYRKVKIDHNSKAKIIDVEEYLKDKKERKRKLKMEAKALKKKQKLMKKQNELNQKDEEKTPPLEEEKKITPKLVPSSFIIDDNESKSFKNQDKTLKPITTDIPQEKEKIKTPTIIMTTPSPKRKKASPKSDSPVSSPIIPFKKMKMIPTIDLSTPNESTQHQINLPNNNKTVEKENIIEKCSFDKEKDIENKNESKIKMIPTIDLSTPNESTQHQINSPNNNKNSVKEIIIEKSSFDREKKELNIENKNESKIEYSAPTIIPSSPAISSSSSTSYLEPNSSILKYQTKQYIHSNNQRLQNYKAIIKSKEKEKSGQSSSHRLIAGNTEITTLLSPILTKMNKASLSKTEKPLQEHSKNESKATVTLISSNSSMLVSRFIPSSSTSNYPTSTLKVNKSTINLVEDSKQENIITEIKYDSKKENEIIKVKDNKPVEEESNGKHEKSKINLNNNKPVEQRNREHESNKINLSETVKINKEKDDIVENKLKEIKEHNNKMEKGKEKEKIIETSRNKEKKKIHKIVDDNTSIQKKTKVSEKEVKKGKEKSNGKGKKTKLFTSIVALIIPEKITRIRRKLMTTKIEQLGKKNIHIYHSIIFFSNINY